jgi:hypothetical protein
MFHNFLKRSFAQSSTTITLINILPDECPITWKICISHFPRPCQVALAEKEACQIFEAYRLTPMMECSLWQLGKNDFE